jgi:Protein of unknown function (DUF3159)
VSEIPEPDQGAKAVDRRTLSALLDTWGGFLDAGLPSLVFVVVYTATGRSLRTALIVAVAATLVLGVVRLVRRDKLSSIATGVFGMALSAVLAWKTGQPRNVFALGILLNAAFFVGYLTSVIVRWPLIGVIVGLARSDGFGWRKDPKMLSAYRRATLIWVAMFVVRLSVQVPLYLTNHVGALGAVRVGLGWPLTILTLVGTFVVLRASVGPAAWAGLRDDLVKVFTGAVEPRTVADRMAADKAAGKPGDPET